MNSRKSQILLNEAKRDAEIGNFNKAASALYFCVRKELECVLLKLGLKIPRRDDKLANTLKHLGYPEESQKLLRLYELRKKADYSDESVSAIELTSSPLAGVPLIDSGLHLSFESREGQRPPPVQICDCNNITVVLITAIALKPTVGNFPHFSTTFWA